MDVQLWLDGPSVNRWDKSYLLWNLYNIVLLYKRQGCCAVISCMSLLFVLQNTCDSEKGERDAKNGGQSALKPTTQIQQNFYIL
jgi:hypothetical protein